LFTVFTSPLVFTTSDDDRLEVCDKSKPCRPTRACPWRC